MCRAALVVLLLLCGVAPATAQRIPFWVKAPLPTPLRHVVVIEQENRTVDNFFNGFPGANTVTTGKVSTGGTVTLQPSPGGITTPYDPQHHYSDFVSACRVSSGKNCQNNGFDLEGCSGTCPTTMAYYFVQQSYVQPYWDMATEGTFSSATFQANEGPSTPAHMYLLAGTSRQANGSNFAAAENPGGTGYAGCNWNGSVLTIDMTTAYPATEGNPLSPACSGVAFIGLNLDAAGVTWAFYQHTAAPTGNGSLWASCNLLSQCCGAVVANACTGAEWAAHVRTPETQIKTDVANGVLPTVSWVVPTPNESDHPGGGQGNNSGPDYVAGIVNAIGNSQYWATTAICVTWDDWGGWYDHVPPPIPSFNSTDPYEYGMRVPLLCLSPYSLRGTVDPTIRDSTSILHFIETVTGITGPINAYSIELQHDDLTSMFNFGQLPLPFNPIALN